MVVENGSPFLFINASAAAARMKSFLGGGTNDVSLITLTVSSCLLF